MLAAELLFLAVLAFLAYAPSLNIQLIADDYPNLSQARSWGAPDGMTTLLGDAQFRLRSTSYWVMCALWNAAGMNPPVYHTASLFLHICNTWLVLALGRAWPPMRTGAFFAAAFFAVHEGHQEAVMWFSAINELLMFFFGLAALACWARDCAAERPSWKLSASGVALFGLALLSKESAVVLLPLFLLIAAPRQWRRLWPHAVLCALAVASIVASRGNSFRFTDGSFSLSAPFWITWPQSLMRLLWIWGWPTLALIFFAAARDSKRTAAITLAWMALALLPYSFLTYSTRIPSRQTYLASAGLALLFGVAAARWRDVWPHRRRLAAAVFALVLVHNIAYLWTKKRAQFLERAAPTDQLLALARRTDAPIFVQCFPLPGIVAEEAVRLAANRSPDTLLWSAAAAQSRPGAVAFCYPEGK
jgi:hypothetical protein